MPYEVDQSGKIEAKYRTVVALSNDHAYTVLIPAKEKQLAFAELRAKYGYAIDPMRLNIRLFAAAVFHLLILADLPAGTTITIDEEYTGYKADIKNLILQWLRRSGLSIPSERLQFGLIGKSPPVHRVAYAVYSQKARPDRTLRAGDLIHPVTGPQRRK